MPRHYQATGTTTNAIATTGGKGSEFKITKEVPYGSTIDTAVGGFHTLFQSSWSYPNRVEDLRHITLKNIGKTVLEVQMIIDSWTNASPDTNISSPAQRILSTSIPPGEEMFLPTLRLLDYSTSGSSADGQVLTNKDHADINSGNLYQDISTITEPVEDSDTSITVANGTLFYAGDLVQLGTNTTTVTRQEIMRVTSISTNVLTVERALYGTSAADKDAQTHGTRGAVDNATIHLPFFNITNNTDQYGGFSTVQTDSRGALHIMNFFGYGRIASHVGAGIVPGSISGKFYEAGYQDLGLSNITSSTNSGLTASTEYGFDITVDGSGLLTSDYMKFTTDSSNVNFGGTNGVISKMQDALDTQYYTTSSNIFEERVTVGIVNGDIRFTSGQRLTTSAILLAAPSAGETTPFGEGRFPAIGSVKAPVAARVPSDIAVDRISGLEIRNEGVLFYDDGLGNIKGAAGGYINYTTGELYLQGVPNANFQFTVNYGSASAGGIRLTAAGNRNAINEIAVRSVNQKMVGKIEFIAYEG